MNVALHLLCLLGVIGLSFSDSQLPEEFVRESEFKDALAQLFAKIAESEQRMLQAQEAATSQLLTQIMDIMPLLLDFTQPKRPGKNKFFDAVRVGDENFVRLWIQNGFVVDEVDLERFHETALHKAARFGHTSIVKDLLSAGANPNAKTQLGFTPLYWAIDVEIVRSLIQAGANPNEQRRFGKTPLHDAVREGRQD